MDRHSTAVEAWGSGPKQSTLLPFIVRNAEPGAPPLVQLLFAKKPRCDCKAVPPDALAMSSALVIFNKYMKTGLEASHYVGRIGYNGALTIYATKCSDLGIKRNWYGRCCDACFEARKDSWKDNIKRKLNKAETSFCEAHFALKQATITCELANDSLGIGHVGKIHLTDAGKQFQIECKQTLEFKTSSLKMKVVIKTDEEKVTSLPLSQLLEGFFQGDMSN
jgi:hypothetical protein